MCRTLLSKRHFTKARSVLAIHRSVKRQIEKGEIIMRLVFLAALAATALYSQEETPDHRLRASTAVLHEIMSAPDKGIPKDLLGKAQCVVIVPGLKKAAFVFGGEYGRGFAVCRNHGVWGRSREAVAQTPLNLVTEVSTTLRSRISLGSLDISGGSRAT